MKKTLRTLMLSVIAVILLCVLCAGMYIQGASEDPSEGYVKQKAPYEDSSIDLWFEHSFKKVLTEDTTPSGMDTYSVYMARNEIENAQFVLYSDETKSQMSATVSDFVNANGDTIPADIYYEMYITTSGLDTTCVLGSTEETTIIREGETPDPIAPLDNIKTFQLNGGKSQAFLIRIKSSESTPSGWYSAQLNVMNAEGQIVKTATVYCYVWDFVISEETEFQSAFFLGNTTAYGGNYKAFYDYLLENRLVAMDPPGGVTSTNPYLTNPRVNAVRVSSNGGGSISTGNYMDNEYAYHTYTDIYNDLSNSDVWEEIKDKLYFYTVDEPMSQEQQDAVSSLGGNNSGHTVEDVIYRDALLENYWGDVAQTCVPYHENHPYPYYHYHNPLSTYPTEQLKDATQAMIETDSCRLWCPHLNAFTPREELMEVGYFEDYHTPIRNITKSISGMYSTGSAESGYVLHGRFYDWDGLYGEFADRVFSDIAIKQKKEGGEAYKMWAYLAGCNSAYTYCHHLIENTGLQTKMLFWQFYQEDITGYLYYATNEWSGTPDKTQTGAKTNAAWLTNKKIYDSGYSVYGIGSLFYGQTQGKIQGVNYIGTLRIELMRDGVEEYQMLKMLESYKGEVAAKNVVGRVSNNVVDYLSLPNYEVKGFDSSMDEYDIMAAVRKSLGDQVEAAVGEGMCEHTYDEGRVIKAANCLEMGTMRYTCQKCASSYDDIIPTLHATGECFAKVSGNTATCTTAGSEIYKCAICGYKKTVDTPAHHDNTEKYSYTVKNATMHSIICSECGKTINDKAHTFFEKNTATCTEAGVILKTCRYCNYSEEVEAVEAKGHNLVETHTAPTCTEPGVDGYACTRCSYTEGTTTKATGHKYGSDNVCTVCGDVKVIPPYVLGDINDDGQISAKDLNLIKKYLAGSGTLTEKQLLAADVTEDGRIAAVDMNLISRYVAGVISEF